MADKNLCSVGLSLACMTGLFSTIHQRSIMTPRGSTFLGFWRYSLDVCSFGLFGFHSLILKSSCSVADIIRSGSNKATKLLTFYIDFNRPIVYRSSSFFLFWAVAPQKCLQGTPLDHMEFFFHTPPPQQSEDQLPFGVNKWLSVIIMACVTHKSGLCRRMPSDMFIHK